MKNNKINIILLFIILITISCSKDRWDPARYREEIYKHSKRQQREGIRTLGLLKNPRDYNFLLGCLYSNDSFIKRNTILAIGDFGDKRGISPLLEIYFLSPSYYYDNIKISLLKIDKNWRDTTEAMKNFKKYLRIINKTSKMNCYRKKAAFRTMLFIDSKKALKYSRKFIENKESCLIAESAKNLLNFNMVNQTDNLINSIELIYKIGDFKDLNSLINSIGNFDKKWHESKNGKKILNLIHDSIIKKKQRLNKKDIYMLRFFNDKDYLKILLNIIKTNNKESEADKRSIAIESIVMMKTNQSLEYIVRALDLKNSSITEEIALLLGKIKDKRYYPYLLKVFEDKDTVWWLRKYIFYSMLNIDKIKTRDLIIDMIEKENMISSFTFLIKDRKIFDAIKNNFKKNKHLNTEYAYRTEDDMVEFFSSFRKKDDLDFFIKLLKQYDEKSREFSAMLRVLAYIADKRFKPILKKYSSSERDDLKTIALWGLTRIGYEK